jgi:hypothetical protein
LTVTPNNPAISSLLFPAATKLPICSILSGVNLVGLPRKTSAPLEFTIGAFVSCTIFGLRLSAARNHRFSSPSKWIFWDGMEAISAERLASPARR